MPRYTHTDAGRAIFADNATDYRDAWLALGPNGTASVGVEVIYGTRDVGDDDRQRATDAAAARLNQAGVVAKDACAAYDAQWSEFDDEKRMTGLAVVWIAAREAADMALTEGWADPCGASCSIRA